MSLSTKQVRQMIDARPCCHPLRPLCELAGIGYDALYMRLRRGGDVRPDEGEALGRALLASLPDGFLAFGVYGIDLGHPDGDDQIRGKGVDDAVDKPMSFSWPVVKSDDQRKLEENGCVFSGQELLANHELDPGKPCYCCGRPNK